MTDSQLIELYNERVAIMQIEGGLTRERASQECFNKIGAYCKRNKRSMPQYVRDDYREVITGKLAIVRPKADLPSLIDAVS